MPLIVFGTHADSLLRPDVYAKYLAIQQAQSAATPVLLDKMVRNKHAGMEVLQSSVTVLSKHFVGRRTFWLIALCHTSVRSVNISLVVHMQCNDVPCLQVDLTVHNPNVRSNEQLCFNISEEQGLSSFDDFAARYATPYLL